MSLPWDKFGPPITEPPLPYRPPPLEDVIDPEPVPPSASSVPPSPPAVAPSDAAKDLVKADAVSRSKRTLIQGLIFDVFAAVIASVALLAGADPFVKETWIGFGVLLIKSVVSAGISYFMRLRKTPTMRTKGEKMAVMPVPRPMAG